MYNLDMCGLFIFESGVHKTNKAPRLCNPTQQAKPDSSNSVHADNESPEGAEIVPHLPVTLIKTNLFLHQALASPQSHFHSGRIKTTY